MAEPAHRRSYSSLTNMSSRIRLSSARETLDIAGTLTMLQSRTFAYDPGILGSRHIYLPAQSLAPSSLLFLSSTTSSLRYTQTKHFLAFWFFLLLVFQLLSLFQTHTLLHSFGFWLLCFYSLLPSISSVVLTCYTLSTQDTHFQTSSCCPELLPFSSSPSLVLSWSQLRLFLLACRVSLVLLGKTDLHLGLCLSCTDFDLL